MKKLLLGMFAIVMTVVLTACGANMKKEPEKAKEVKMSDIINSEKKHVVFTVIDGFKDKLVTRINVVQNGKVTSYYIRGDDDSSDNPDGYFTLKEASKMSIGELEEYGKNRQSKVGFPPAFAVPVKYWVSDEGKVSYSLNGYMRLYSNSGQGENNSYSHGTTAEEASKDFYRVSNFKRSENKTADAYQFDGIVKPNDDSYNMHYDNQPVNHYMDLKDTNLAGYDNGGYALLTKIDKNSKMVSETPSK